MYLYFDAQGKLEEIISDDILRTANDNINCIYAYAIGNRTVSAVTFTILKSDGSVLEKVYSGTEVKQIPYSDNRDLKYFTYFTNYTFYKYTLTSNDLLGTDFVAITVRFYGTDNTIFAEGTCTAAVEASSIADDPLISTSQYNYLMSLLNDLVNLEDIDGGMFSDTTFTETTIDGGNF